MMKISVAMCTYNGDTYVAEQLDSILHQTHVVNEVVIRDDGSNDSTVSILQTYQQKYPNIIRLYTNDHNLGPRKNFEKALSLSTGDIVFLSDQDDIWHADKVAEYIDFFAQNPGTLLIFNDGNIIDSYGKQLHSRLWDKWSFSEEKRRRWTNNNLALEDLLRQDNKITGASIALRKELLTTALPMHPSSAYWHDAWLGIFAAKANGLRFIERPLFDYRVHNNQLVGVLDKSPYPMAKKAICTIIAPNYIAQARALTKSFLEQEPDGIVYALIVDTSETLQDFSKEKFIAIPVQNVQIAEFRDMALRYTIRELCTAVKPFFLQHLFDTYGLEKICYFDPDIYVYSSIEILWESLETYDAVVTPHILQPLDEVFLPNEFSILQAGTYNLGFIGIRKSNETKKLLTWWSERLVKYSHGAPERHEHFDQRWIDLLPGFLERVDINRNPGLNVAYWDLSNRSIHKKDNIYYVNDVPLIFFHFSGYSPSEPTIISKHQNRFTFRDKPELQPLFDRYGKMLLDFGYESNNKPAAVPNTIARRSMQTSEYIQDFGPRIYGKLTRYLADQGWEEFLTSLLGKNTISNIRSLFLGVPRRKRIKTRISSDYGVNILGLAEVNNGVGIVAKSIADALTANNIPLLLIDAFRPTTQPERYPISILNINADITRDIAHNQDVAPRKGEYVIGYWWWELDTFPRAWTKSFSAVNEIWVGSEFVKNALSSVSPVPIYVMGTPVERQLATPLERSSLGIPEESFIFLFIFDFQSYTERKNPYALIEAYHRAFNDKKMPTTLVMKVSNASEFPNESKRLQDAVATVSGVYIDTAMSTEELSGLFLMADAYVSLHRSEGFGLTIAEAMYFGKPVIATNYSGNTDYMNTANSYPVAYELIKLEKSVGPYEKGNVWAEPDLDETVRHMQYVTTHKKEAGEKGKQAAQDIRMLYSNTVVGKRMAKRIADIYEQLT